MAVPLTSRSSDRRSRSVRNRILVESDEVNILIFAYLVESGHVASASAFRSEAHLDTSPFFDTLRPDVVNIGSASRILGDNALRSRDNAGTETPVPSSSRKRTTSGKDLQEIRAAAKAAVHNSGSSTPALSGKDKDTMEDQSEDGTREGNNAGLQKFLPRDELIAYLQRGLLWQEAVHHANEEVLQNCVAEFRLLEPHTCSARPARKLLRTLPYSTSRNSQLLSKGPADSKVEQAMELQSQKAMEELPVFSALRDMHMQEQVPQRLPPREIPLPMALPAPQPKLRKDLPSRSSLPTEDIAMPYVARKKQSGSETKTKSFVDKAEKSHTSDDKLNKVAQSKMPSIENETTKMPACREADSRDQRSRTTMDSSARKPTFSTTRSDEDPAENITSRVPRDSEDLVSKRPPKLVRETLNRKDNEPKDSTRSKEKQSAKKDHGRYSDSDEEEGPVIKRRKIMGGGATADSGDYELSAKKAHVDKEGPRIDKDRTDDGKIGGRALEKKQKLAAEDRRSRQGTPSSEKSRSGSTILKEKRPKLDQMLSFKEKSTEHERKSSEDRPRKNSQASSSTKVAQDTIEDVKPRPKADKKKKAAEGKSKAGGKSEINPLVPTASDGALIWKWKGVHKRVIKVAWSPNLNKLAACSFDGHCGIFDFEEANESDSGKLKALAKTPDKCSHRGIESLKPVTDVEWNPEGTLLGTICDDGVARTFTPDGSLNSILTRHAGPIRHLAFNQGPNRDEGILVTAGSDGQICTWNLDNGNVKWMLNYHVPNQAYFVNFMDGQIFATCSEDTTIGLCSTKSSNPLMILKGHTDRVLMVKFSPPPKSDSDKQRRLLASASEDKTIRVWDVEGLVERGAQLFASMGGSYNERLAAAKGLDTTSRSSSAPGKPAADRDGPSAEEGSDIPTQIMKLEGHEWDVTIVQWDPQGIRKDGKRLLLSASQCNDSEVDEDAYKAGHLIKMYDVNAKSASNRCLYTLNWHEATINGLEFSPDGSKFASVSDDRTMVIWDTLTGKELKRYETDTQLNDVCWRYDGKQLAIAAEDSTIRTFYIGDI
ncbi:hypothetical protein QFC21_000081 [Naganishia friedmannii]|uniref:Uncharacterized protein n=1 Tax=Naganishia friedmannii TaxID=89922 RepID=A0ACC2WD20_9TREE|nr:hypothetical protein QFC21_000081 [Naganishia friedmannii]